MNLKTLEQAKTAQSYDLYTSDKRFFKDDAKISAYAGMFAGYKVKVLGQPAYRSRVKKAFQFLSVETKIPFLELQKKFPAKFIKSSERTVFDGELQVLYLSCSLTVTEIKLILDSLLQTGDVSAGAIKQESKLKHAAKTNLLAGLKRKFFRVSIENKLKNDAIKIISYPPRCKVATEDQHFLMNIMRLEMFIKAVALYIEKSSIVFLMCKKRAELLRNLSRLQESSLKGFDTEKIIELKTEIKALDSMIYSKRITIQNRLISRILYAIEGWQMSGDAAPSLAVYKSKLSELNKKISSFDLQIKAIREKYNENMLKKRGAGLRVKRINRIIIKLKRKQIKLSYMVTVYDKQKNFSEKLKNYFMKIHENELIPESYKKSWKSKLFDSLRIFLNMLFMGFYLYIIKTPYYLMPFFLILGLFVFQPIANKFAILFMSPFVKNPGLKRLSMTELKSEIEKKAGKKRYICAIDLPIFTGKESELETTAHYITRNLKNLKNTMSYLESLSIVYQVTSNTSDESLVEKEVKIIKRVQKLADNICGKDRVYFIYLHRASGIAKKVGNIVAGHMFKLHGYTRPVIYTDSKRFILTFENKPFFDCAYGNFSASLCRNGNYGNDDIAGNREIIKDILEGKRINISCPPEFTFFVDNKNEIKVASLEKSLAIMLHPENKNIAILQPLMSIEDPVSYGQRVTSAFLRMTRIARDIHNVRYLNTLHGLCNNMSAYYGKGMIRIKSYDYMIKNEVLNLKYVDSHDWQESVFNHAVLAIPGDGAVAALKAGDKNCQWNASEIKHNSAFEEIQSDDRPGSYNILVRKVDESSLYRLDFYAGSKADASSQFCRVTDESGHERIIKLSKSLGDKTDEGRIKEVAAYLDNGVEVGERELISTIGNYSRDTRWLKGDLQMFNTFASYRQFMPAYHKFHLENIFRRLTGEIALFLWVLLNFSFAVVAPFAGMFSQQIIFILTLYLAVTAFGFAGIDLFLYPIFFEVDNRIRFKPYSVFNNVLRMVWIILKKIVAGTWQFILYLMIAWPRVLLGIKSTIKILFAGIDQPMNWGSLSNAGISAQETERGGIPFSRFFKFYFDGIVIGILLGALLGFLVYSGYAYASMFLPVNMGLIVASLILGPIVSYLISKKIYC